MRIKSPHPQGPESLRHFGEKARSRSEVAPSRSAWKTAGNLRLTGPIIGTENGWKETDWSSGRNRETKFSGAWRPMEGVRRVSNRRRCCFSETVPHAQVRRALPQALTLDDAAKPERKARSRLPHVHAARRAHRRKANPTAASGPRFTIGRDILPLAKGLNPGGSPPCLGRHGRGLMPPVTGPGA
jgi:hypothetical protein